MGFGGGSGTSSLGGSSDAVFSNPATGQAIVYDSSISKWKNIAVTTSVAGRSGAITLAESDVTNLSTDLANRIQTSGGGLETVQIVASSGSSLAISLATGNMAKITLTANCTFAFSGATNGKACSLTLMLQQDTTGSRLVTWPSSVHWAGGTSPTLSTGASKIDFIGFLSIDGGSNWYGFVSGQNY